MLSPNYVLTSLSSLTLILLLSFCGANSLQYSDIPRVEDITYIGNALHEGLMYLKNHNETKILDVALGILLVKGSLRWIEYKLQPNSTAFSNISELSHLCDVVFSEVVAVSRGSENSKERKFSALLKHLFYDITAEDLKYGSLKKKVSAIGLPNLKNCSFFTDYILKGTPNDSDSCIIELFDKSCDISPSCWFLETNQLVNLGYKKSHRLLYLQLALKLNCGKDEREMKRMKASICQSMLEEAIALYGQDVFFARDLFLEQIALCGFEGYAEFSDRSWSVEILKWRRSEGCFGLLRGEKVPEESCGWKSDLNGTLCSVHLTAVAVSAIAFHLRVAFDQI